MLFTVLLYKTQYIYYLLYIHIHCPTVLFYNSVLASAKITLCSVKIVTHFLLHNCNFKNMVFLASVFTPR